MATHGLLMVVLAVGEQANDWLSAAAETTRSRRSLALLAVCLCWMSALWLSGVQERRGSITWYMVDEGYCQVLSVVLGMRSSPTAASLSVAKYIVNVGSVTTKVTREQGRKKRTHWF